MKIIETRKVETCADDIFTRITVVDIGDGEKTMLTRDVKFNPDKQAYEIELTDKDLIRIHPDARVTLYENRCIIVERDNGTTLLMCWAVVSTLVKELMYEKTNLLS